MSIQRDVYDKLKTAIVYGELSPGQKLSEIKLASKMNASRTPIREALRQLQMEGYITVIPNKGAHVSKLPTDEIEEIYDIISLLEGRSAELAAKKASDSDLDTLMRCHKKLVLYAGKARFRDYIRTNTEFHRLITQMSGNRNLERIITELRTRIYRYRLMSVTIPGYLREYAVDHKIIVESIVKGNSAQARRNMENHVSFVKKVLVDFLRRSDPSG